ncbi:uncharacterized protein SAPINGB_P002014 [Magnusiomyces paraingens]|uniref:CENP-T/Histone H4 histone fold domain-containing protein n=1 Tax=Magnusiomyces paraingens TaxID=2606893 RepID=A0A5E8BCB2_9ASCO|nr:uncharacterized protein SAPINGB_P002014 [Saprochaete ingens]VVT48917.1 unnamed protein product [Saprochaete ingens]
MSLNLESKFNSSKTSASSENSNVSSSRLKDNRATPSKRITNPYQMNTTPKSNYPIVTTPFIRKFRSASLGRRSTIFETLNSIDAQNNSVHSDLDNGLIGILRQLSRQLVIEFKEENQDKVFSSVDKQKNERRKTIEHSKILPKKLPNSLDDQTLEQQYLQKLAISGKEINTDEVEFFIDNKRQSKEEPSRQDSAKRQKSLETINTSKRRSTTNIKNTTHELEVKNSDYNHKITSNNIDEPRLSQPKSNFVIKINTTPTHEAHRLRSSFGRSDREVEIARKAQDRLSLTDRRLSEIFPEFNTTQIEEDDESFERNEDMFKDKMTNLSEYTSKPLKSRKLSLNEPFKIQINNVDIPMDNSQSSIELEGEGSEVILDRDDKKRSLNESFVINIDLLEPTSAPIELNEDTNANKNQNSPIINENISTSFESSISSLNPNSGEKKYSSDEDIIDGSKVQLRKRDINDMEVNDDDDDNSIGGFDFYEASNDFTDQNDESIVKDHSLSKSKDPFPDYTLEDEEIYRRQVDFDQEKPRNEQALSPVTSGSFVFQKPWIKNKLEKRTAPTVSKVTIKDFAGSFVLSRRKLSPDAMDALVDAQDLFFKQMGLDLAAYSKHAGRKRIDVDDVLALMKRQRVLSATSRNNSALTATNGLNETVPVDLIAQQFFPQELVDDLVDAVTIKHTKKASV